MQPVGNNKYVLIGVVSFGFKCAEPGYVCNKNIMHANFNKTT